MLRDDTGRVQIDKRKTLNAVAKLLRSAGVAVCLHVAHGYIEIGAGAVCAVIAYLCTKMHSAVIAGSVFDGIVERAGIALLARIHAHSQNHQNRTKEYCFSHN